MIEKREVIPFPACGYEDCTREPTTIAGIVFGPWRLGPVEIPVCDIHAAKLKASITLDMTFDDLREKPCPRCFGKGLENQDNRPGILLGPLGEAECRQCGGTGRVPTGETVEVLERS